MQSTYFVTYKKIQLSSFHWEPGFTKAMYDFKPEFKSTEKKNQIYNTKNSKQCL